MGQSRNVKYVEVRAVQTKFTVGDCAKSTVQTRNKRYPSVKAITIQMALNLPHLLYHGRSVHDETTATLPNQRTASEPVVEENSRYPPQEIVCHVTNYSEV